MSDQPDDPVRTSQRLARQELPRRFYTAATVGSHADGFAILLDGKPVRTPGRRTLAFADAVLAAAVAAEWASQGERIDPASMPLTRILNAAIDHVVNHMAAVRAEIVKYAGSDLVCYRAGSPASLVAAEAAGWDPLIAWAREALGARFVLGEGVVHVAQDPGAVAAIDDAVADLGPEALAAIHTMTSLTGSAIIAVAVLRHRLTATEGWAAAHISEDWQMEHWGTDQAALARRAARWQDMSAAALILRATAG